MTDLQPLCDVVMRGVVATGVVTGENIPRAVEVIRAEIKAFVTGDDYADCRAAVLEGAVPDTFVVASVIAVCVLKLRAAEEPLR